MVLNYIWIAFFLIAFIVAIVKAVFFGDMEVFPSMVSSTFDMAKLGFELSLGLTGVMTLWLGIMKVGEKGGAVNLLSKGISPLFNKLFPDIHLLTMSLIIKLIINFVSHLFMLFIYGTTGTSICKRF